VVTVRLASGSTVTLRTDSFCPVRRAASQHPPPDITIIIWTTPEVFLYLSCIIIVSQSDVTE
jgi:hypothetical protein